MQSTFKPSNATFWLSISWENFRSVVIDELSFNIVVSKFKLQSLYYVYFQTMNPFIPTSNGLNSTTIVLLWRWFWRCPWCNGYRRRKWTRWHEFNSWTRLIEFHITLIPFGKVWIELFSLQLRVNSRADWVFQPWWGN